MWRCWPEGLDILYQAVTRRRLVEHTQMAGGSLHSVRALKHNHTPVVLPAFSLYLFTKLAYMHGALQWPRCQGAVRVGGLTNPPLPPLEEATRIGTTVGDLHPVGGQKWLEIWIISLAAIGCHSARCS